MQTNEINVAFAADENYVQPMSVAITSILKNASKSDILSFYILCNNVSELSKSKLLQLKKIKNFKMQFIDIDEEILKSFLIYDGSHITRTCYYRLQLPNLLPDLDKILYLDCDLIIKKSLKNLFNTDIEQCYIAGVEDIGCTFLFRFPQSNNWYNFLPIVNSGVLLMNLKKWREADIWNKAKTLVLSGGGSYHLDQEIINRLCHEKCLLLDMSWNVQDSFYRNNLIVKSNPNVNTIKKTAQKPKILHYTTWIKPWVDVTMPMAREWWYYNKFSSIPLKMSNSQKLRFWFARYGKIFSVIIHDNKFIIKILGIKFSSSLKK